MLLRDLRLLLIVLPVSYAVIGSAAAVPGATAASVGVTCDNTRGFVAIGFGGA